MIDRNYPGLSNVLAASLLWRCGVAIVHAFAAAWESSVTARLVRVTAGLANTSSLSTIAAIALGALALARPMLPEYVRPGLPAMWGISATVVAIVIAVFASSFERAWPDSWIGRALTLLRTER